MIVKTFMERFAPKVEDGRKKHTVRPWPKRMPKVGDEISLRTWTGKPYRSKQRELMRSIVTAVRGIAIKHNGIKIDGRPTDAEKFAIADGFETFRDLKDWFRAVHGQIDFTGILIEWA